MNVRNYVNLEKMYIQHPILFKSWITVIIAVFDKIFFQREINIVRIIFVEFPFKVLPG